MKLLRAVFTGGRPEMKDKIQIGWFAPWLALRAVTAAAFYASFLGLYLEIRSPHPDLRDVFMFAFWGSVGVALHPLSTGHADRTGIHFRRYLLPQFARWDDVETVLWSTQQVLVLFRGKRGLQSFLDFKVHAGPMDALTEAFGERVREPEFIRWLGSAPVEQTRRFEVRHMDRPRYSFWRKPSLFKGQLLALACVWTLAAVLAIFSAVKPH